MENIVFLAIEDAIGAFELSVNGQVTRLTSVGTMRIILEGIILETGKTSVFHCFAKTFLGSRYAHHGDYRVYRTMAQAVVDTLLPEIERRAKMRMASKISKLVGCVSKKTRSHTPCMTDDALNAQIAMWTNQTDNIACTYFMRNSRGEYKIGRSVHPTTRRKELNYQFPDIRVIAILPFDRERELHEKYSHKRLYGEWFEFTAAEAEEFIKNEGFLKL